NAPAEYRGEFQPIATNVNGITISDQLPKLAAQMDKFTILRGVSHTLAAHELGSQYVNTGNRPIPSIEFPGFGAVVTKELGGSEDLPPFVSVPTSPQKSGYLGVRYAPLSTGKVPAAGKPFSVRGVTLGNGLTVSDVERRRNLLEDLDTTFRDIERQNQLLDGLDRFGDQAYAMITSTRSREAFDLSKEAPSFADPFGKSGFGQSCLLASRLIESGVRFVTVNFTGWDTHKDNWLRLKTKQLPPFDEGLSALFWGLSQKGLLESTTVFVTGEFGRTPKINSERVGRDHYPRAMFMLLAGGGIKPGQVLGVTDEKAQGPIGEGFSPDQVAASFYHSLGIDSRKEYHTSIGRPVMIVRDGRIIPELFG
ncbi:MAG: DUF1501 domain-containing protein, partial [Planctomycetes bacterium]|nr:DUF1501 domain-containing protein [Planctomycetota bacterium]